MNWIPLTSIAQLDEVDLQSGLPNSKVAIFKHSTRCSISSMAKNRLDKANASMPVYYLDLLKYRSVSDEIANRYGITHESPQLLIIENKKVIEHSSHNMVSPAQLI